MAIVETDETSQPLAELHTTATIIPRATIEEVSNGKHALLPGESAHLQFVARSFGTKQKPPAPLEGDVLQGDCGLAWAAAPAVREEDAEHGLVSIRRVFVATLEARGEPGSRVAEVRLVAEGTELARRRIVWEVAPAVQAIPSGFFVSRGGAVIEKNVVLRATDGRPFRIVATRSGAGGIEVQADATRVETVHRLVLRIEPDADVAADHTAEVTVSTDHPLQREVKVPILVAGAPATSPTPREPNP